MVHRGGNIDVQTAMLNTLKDKRDAGFFTSLAGLMSSCTVLNLDAFERNTKAEGLGVGPDGPAGEKNMHDAEFTTLLFRSVSFLGTVWPAVKLGSGERKWPIY